MNLEALALRRAEETLEHVSREDFVADAPKLRIVKPYKPKPAAGLLCACGKCHRCRNRVAMRAFRAAKRAGQVVPKKRGRQTTAGKTCSGCGVGIWDKSETGMCGVCARDQKRKVGHVAKASGHYSHGGGI